MYCLDNARHPDQLAAMRAAMDAGICVFCPEHLHTDPNQKVLHRRSGWTVVPNRYPYAGAGLHLLLIPDDHVCDLGDLDVDDGPGLISAVRWAKSTYGYAGAALATRIGDLEHTGATIEHLHLHLVVGDPAGAPVLFKMSNGTPAVDSTR